MAPGKRRQTGSTRTTGQFLSKLLAYHHPPGGAGRALSERTADFGAEAPAIAETEITAEFDTERVAKPLIALDTISEARQAGIVERLAAAVAKFVTPFDPDPRRQRPDRDRAPHAEDACKRGNVALGEGEAVKPAAGLGISVEMCRQEVRAPVSRQAPAIGGAIEP